MPLSVMTIIIGINNCVGLWLYGARVHVNEVLAIIHDITSFSI